MNFRKPEPLTVGDDLDPPTLSVRQFDADEEHAKAGAIATKARSLLKGTMSDLPEALSETVAGALSVPRPDRDRTVEDVGETVNAVLGDRLSHFNECRSYLRKRMEEALEELPNIESGRAAPGESDVRAWVREAPADERMERVRTVVESGNPKMARALFRDTIPAPAAGFPNEDHRRRLRDEALRTIAPRPFETASSLGADLEALGRDRDLVEQFAEKLTHAAVNRFDHELAKFEARK